MANSGLVYTQITPHNNLYFSWWEERIYIENNVTVIGWELYITSDEYGAIQSDALKKWRVRVAGNPYSGSTFIGIEASSRKSIKTGSVQITHNENGEKTMVYSYSLAADITFSGQSIGTVEGNGETELSPLPRVFFTDDVAPFTDLESPTIKYKNMAGSAVKELAACISFTGRDADIPYKKLDINSTSYTFNFTNEEKAILQKGMVDSKSRTVRFYLRTRLENGVEFKDYRFTTLTIAYKMPLLQFDYEDTNPQTIELTGGGRVVVKNKSTVVPTIKVVSQDYATFVSGSITCGKRTVSRLENVEFKNAESSVFTIKATDSRGYTTTWERNIGSLVEYTSLSLYLKTGSVKATEDTLTFTASGVCFYGNFGKSYNMLTQLQYRLKAGSEDFGEWQDMSFTHTPDSKYTSTVTLSGLDYRTVYKVEVRAADALETRKASSGDIGTKPLFDWSNEDFNFNIPVKANKILLPQASGSVGSNIVDNGILINERTVFGADALGSIVINYPGYTSADTNTNIYGNKVNIVSNEGFNINGKAFGEQTILHTDEGRFMNAEQTISLTGNKRLSQQHTGYIICWYFYNNGLLAQNIQYSFIPKAMLEVNSLVVLPVALTTGETGVKTLKITESGITTTITGDDSNSASSPNNKLVLRRIIGY